MSDKIQEDEDRKAVEEHFAGKRSIDDLTEAQIELAVDLEKDIDNGDVQEPEKEVVEEIEEKADQADLNKILADALAEKNRYKQLNDDKERKLASLKEDVEFRNKYLGIETEVKVDPDRDYLDDSHQAKLEARLAAIEERERNNEEKTNRERAELAREKKQLEVFKEISSLQDSHSNLKTTESFQSIDKKFVDWKSTLVANGVEEDKYFADAEYRKQQDAKGFKLNVSQKDLDKAFKIYKIYGTYKAEVDAGYKSSIERAYMGSSDYKELVKNQYSSHRRADDDALDSLIEERSKEVSLLNTGGAPSDSGDIGSLLDEQDAITRKTAPTEADKKRYLEIDKMLNLMT